jgi:glucose-6-phosphate 1-dehydrogenase
MAPKIVTVDPFDLVVFGGNGDLAYRKLYPALLHREASDQFSEPTRIIGVSRRPFTREQFVSSVEDSALKFGPRDEAAQQRLVRFLPRFAFVAVDVTGEAGWDRLRAALGPDEGRIRAIASPPVQTCSRRLRSVSAPTDSRRRARALSSRSRSATTASALQRSMMRSAVCFRKRRFFASTITSARNPYRI